MRSSTTTRAWFIFGLLLSAPRDDLDPIIEHLQEVTKPAPPDDSAVVRELNDIEDAIIINGILDREDK